MTGLITPDELPIWVPGVSTVDSARLGWEGVRVRRWRYTGLDVFIPALSDYLIVAYRDGATQMNRRCTGDWREEPVAPGAVSLLTHAAQSHWRWSEDVEVMHLYLSPAVMAGVAADAYGRHIRNVELADVLRADDPVLAGIAAALDREASDEGVGCKLYVEALRTHACVHILRRYANVAFSDEERSGGFSRAQAKLLKTFVDEHLEQALTLETLAGVVRLSAFHFARKFRETFGCPPYAYVMRRRIERAAGQLANPAIPLKVVAAECGFSDQSHMTRLFRRATGVTPAEFRRDRTS